MANERAGNGKTKTVRANGYLLAIPAGMSAEDEAAMVADLTAQIENNPEIQERRALAAARRERFEARWAAAKAAALKEQIANYQKLNGGDNPAQ